MAGDEVDVASQGLVEELEDLAPQVVQVDGFEGSGVVLEEFEGEAVLVLGLEPVQILEEGNKLVGLVTCGQVFAQVLEEIAIVGSAGPAVRALLCVGIEQTHVKTSR